MNAERIKLAYELAKEEYAAKMFGTEKEATVNASEEIGGEGKATGKSGEGLQNKLSEIFHGIGRKTCIQTSSRAEPGYY